MSARDATPVTDHPVVEGFKELLGPPPPPTVPGLEIACLYAPAGAGRGGAGPELAGIGGDFIDFYSQRGLAQLGVAIGDVAGKGLDAALLAVVAKFMVRSLVTVERWPLPPGDLLMHATNALLAHLEDHASRFVTLLVASINGKDGTVTLSSAGHPVPAIVRADRVERPMALVVPAIGVTTEVELQALPAEEVTLAPGDALLFFTDGLSDAHNAAGEFYEDVRMAEALEELRGLPAAQLLQRLLDDAVVFAGHGPADDVALVLVRRTPSGGD